ncbi:MAG TPA: hypothetical protein VH234_01005 [Candidatus Saccharimonadales bacterium]|jgi:hypothetical protein|nr:hypothetical protein [Candidatus Saccharimonadales bacterium]
MRIHYKVRYAYLSLLTLPLLAYAPALAAAVAISQGYHANQSIAAGTLVASGNQSNTIVVADASHQSSLLGVVVTSNSSSLATTSTFAQTQVVTSGTVQAYVTDLNGVIKTGDPITISPIKGVGMKATNAGTIVGMAAGNTSHGAGSPVTVRSSDGSLHHATVQSIPISVSTEVYNPFLGGKVLGSVQNFVDTIANRPVSLARLVMSSLVLLFAALAVTIVLYTGIHNAFISIGRNPLAKYVINRALIKTIVGAIVIVGSSLGFAYLILVA